MKKMIPLIAATAVSMPVLAAEPNAFYGAFGGGSYQLKSEGFDDTAPATSLLGGYQLNERFAIEAGYSHLFNAKGTADGIGVKVDGNVWDLSTKMSVPVGNRFSFHGRVGWSYLDLNAIGTFDGVRVRVNDHDNAFSWAVGTGYKLNPRFSLSGEYSQAQIDQGDFDRMSLLLNYRFGQQ